MLRPAEGHQHGLGIELNTTTSAITTRASGGMFNLIHWESMRA